MIPIQHSLFYLILLIIKSNVSFSLFFLRETVRIHSVMGLGIAYAGTSRLDLLEILTPIVVDTGLSCELSAMAALALGLIFVGKCTEDVSGAILETLMESIFEKLLKLKLGQENVLDIAISRYFAVALGLLFLG